MQLLVMKSFIIMIQAKIVLRHTWRHHLHLGANANGDGDNDGDDSEGDDDDGDDDGDDDDDDFIKVFHPCPPQSGLATPPGQDKRRLERESRADQTCLNNLFPSSTTPLNFLLNKPVGGDLSQLLTDGG